MSTTLGDMRRSARAVRSRRNGGRTENSDSNVNLTVDARDVLSVLAHQLPHDARVSRELLHVVRVYDRLPRHGDCGVVGYAAPISIDERLGLPPDGISV